jgi:hypothetical protein
MKIEMLEEVEHEDGSVTYNWDIDEEGTKVLTEVGLKFLIYSRAAGMTSEEAFNKIVDQLE